MAVETARDVAVTGSNVLSDAGTSITAGRNVDITAAIESNASSSDYSERSSGLLGGGGLSLTLGTRSQSSAQKQAGDTAAGSVIGSTGGSVSIQAGQTYTQTGSDVLAPQGDIGIQAKKVDITEAREKRSDGSESKFSQSGITVALSVPVIEAVQGIAQMAGAVQDTRSERAKAMGAAMAALKTREALAAGEAAAKSLADGQVPDGVSLSVSLGRGQSRSSSASTGDSGRGSSVAAGGDVTIRATGGGSSVQAGGDIALKADNRVRLLSSQDTSAQSGSDSSGSAAIGLSLGLGEQSAGLSLTLAASRALGHRNGNATTQQDSTVAAGKTLTIDSGGDTDILGGTASGETVKAMVGGDLNMASRQDTATFEEDSKNIGFNASIPLVGSGGSASLSAGKTNIRSDYASTQTTSGIKAGDGGFDVQVQGKTTLDGAVIASSDAAVAQGRNRFRSEGGLELKDITNSAKYSADSVSAGVGISGGKPDNSGEKPAQKSGPTLNSAGIGTDSGNASSITQAGISGIAGDTSVRSGDVGSGIKPIFDADTVRADVNAQVAITKEFAPMAANEWGTQADTMALKAQAEGRTEDAAKWAEGGAYRAAGHAVLGGLTGGSAAAAAGAGASSLAAPTLDKVQAGLASGLKSAGLSQEMAASLAGATVATTTGITGTVAGGTAAGMAALNQDANNRQLHPDEAQKLALLQAGKSKDQQERLTAAACYLAKCAEGVSPDDPKYAEVQELQRTGQAYSAEQNMLKATGSFEYKPTDTVNDFLLRQGKAIEKIANVIQSGSGALGVVGGVGVTAAAASACGVTAGVTCLAVPVGTGLVYVSQDDFVQGLKKLATEYQYTDGQRVLDSFSPDTYPGDRNRLAELGTEATKAAVLATLAKLGGTLLGKAAGLQEVGDAAKKQLTAGVNAEKGTNRGVVADEAAALSRIGEKPNGPYLTEKPSNTILNQEAIKNLAAGKLPGITKDPKTGLPNADYRVGVPREMPASLNPNATAEDFALRMLGRFPVSDEVAKGEKMFGGNCPGCWIARNDAGVDVTFRPAGKSTKTIGATASVDINFKNDSNVLNGGKILKLKFPAIK